MVRSGQPSKREPTDNRKDRTMQKKFFLLTFALLMLGASPLLLSGKEVQKAPCKKVCKTKGYMPGKWDFSIFQLSFFDYDYMMLFSPETEIRGINTGLQNVNSSKGISVALSQEAESVAGLTIAPSLIAGESSLLHITLFGHVLSNKALAIGIYNKSYYNHFLQIGCFNDAIRTSIGQIGVWNIGPGRKDNDGLSAFQIGFMNSADSGLQIGVFNYNKNSLLPYTILFNYSSPDKARANGGKGKK